MMIEKRNRNDDYTRGGATCGFTCACTRGSQAGYGRRLGFVRRGAALLAAVVALPDASKFEAQPASSICCGPACGWACGCGARGSEWERVGASMASMASSPLKTV